MTKEQFIAFVRKEQESLRRFLLVLCKGDSFRADDIAQEALLKAYLSFNKYEGRAKFSSWLFRIAYNCFYDNIKLAKKYDNEPLSISYNSIPDNFTPDKKFEHQQLYNAISSLNDAEKAIILLFYMEEKSIKEIEVIMEMPQGTIRSHLSRGRKRLRIYLDENNN